MLFNVIQKASCHFLLSYFLMVCTDLLNMQLFCLFGIIGQYIAKIYLETKHRPHFIVAEDPIGRMLPSSAELDKAALHLLYFLHNSRLKPGLCGPKPVFLPADIILKQTP